MTFDEQMMSRALRLARCGRGSVSPNPMVGAVIVCGGAVICEGYHRRYGGPHAEVNAVNSVADKELLHRSTIYVTLEPCAHYGKTPPCAELIVRCGFKRVVVGCRDPFAKVNGLGIEIIRRAGIEVEVGVLERECRNLNVRFMTAHSLHRPYILLKWACSADGFTAAVNPADGKPAAVKFSSPTTATLLHLLRSDYDAIAVGCRTLLTDNPRLDARLTGGKSPRPVVFTHSTELPEGFRLSANPATIICNDSSLAEAVGRLYSEYGLTSLMVEGGSTLLRSFIDAGLWDEARVEIAPFELGGRGILPMLLPDFPSESCKIVDQRRILTYRNPLKNSAN